MKFLKNIASACKRTLSYTKKAFNAFCLFLFGLSVSHASVLPADVDTVFSDAKADILKVVGLALGLVLIIVAFRYVKRVLS